MSAVSVGPSGGVSSLKGNGTVVGPQTLKTVVLLLVVEVSPQIPVNISGAGLGLPACPFFAVSQEWDVWQPTRSRTRDRSYMSQILTRDKNFTNVKTIKQKVRRTSKCP